MPSTDADLLTVYARDRNEGAFRQLAERHFALIYHTALRRTGRHVLAQEVSQNVLCLLARKAAPLLLKADRLPAWLHRATVLEAAKAMRQEATSQRHAALQHPDEIPGTAIPPDPGLWESCLPFLDEALDSLPESDRQVLALHYLENLSFPRISELSGKPAATLQKQSIRALAKLSSILTWRIRSGRRVRLQLDFHSSLTAAVTAGMKAESAKAAPTSLISSMAHTAATAFSAPGILTKLILMSATHSKAILGGTLLLLALPLGLQQLAIARTRAELADLSASESSGLSRQRLKPKALSVTFSADSALFQLSEEAMTAKNVEPIRLKLHRRFSAMSPEEMLHLLEQIDASSLGQTRRSLLQDMLGPLLMEKDTPAGMRMAVTHSWLEMPWVVSAYGNWIHREPEAAGQWLQETHAQALQPTDRKKLIPCQAMFITSLLATRPSEAPAFFNGFAPEEVQEVMQDALQHSSSYAGGMPLTTDEASGWIDILRSLPDGTRKSLFEQFGRMCYDSRGSGSRSPDAMKALEGTDLSVGERRIIAESAADYFLLQATVKPESDLRPKTLAWLDRFIPEEAEAVKQATQAHLDSAKEQEAVQMLDYYRKMPLASDEDLMTCLTIINPSHHLDEALELASRIRDPEKRAKAEAQLREKP